MQRQKKSLAQKAAPKRPEWPSYGNFRNVTEDPHFLKKRKQRLQKCPDGQVMAIFSKVTQNQHFQKKCKGETKRNFSKIAKQGALVWKA